MGAQAHLAKDGQAHGAHVAQVDGALMHAAGIQFRLVVRHKKQSADSLPLGSMLDAKHKTTQFMYRLITCTCANMHAALVGTAAALSAKR